MGRFESTCPENASSEVVYQAEPRWAKQTVRFLRSRGLRPFYVENPSPVVLQKSHGTYRVHVAVPAEQAAAARSALAAWEREATPRVKRLGRAVLLQILIVVAVPALVLLLLSGMLERAPEEMGIAVAYGLAIVTAALIALWQRRKLGERK